MPGSTRQTPSQRSSLIAAGTRIEGAVVFAGTLHLRGEIAGDVTCADDSGTLVVDTGGVLSGSAEAPHLVVRGRLQGPSKAAQSIEVESGGSVVGPSSYRSLAIHAGGQLDGLLTPLDTAVGERPRSASRPTPPPNLEPAPMPRPRPAKKPLRSGSRGTRNLALAISAVLIVAATLTWTKRDGPRQSAVAALPELATGPSAGAAADAPAEPAAASATAAEKETPAAKEAKAAPRSKPEPPAAKPEPAREAAPTRPTPAAEKKPAEPAERPEPDLDTVVAVKGVNADKPAATIYVITREPVVVYKKMPDVAGKGTRLAFSRDRNTGIRIAPGELLRVAQGEDLDLYYQGGKVWSNPIENGTWMRFEAIEPPPPPKPEPTPEPPAPKPARGGTPPAAVPAAASPAASTPAAPSPETPAAARPAGG